MISHSPEGQGLRSVDTQPFLILASWPRAARAFAAREGFQAPGCALKAAGYRREKKSAFTILEIIFSLILFAVGVNVAMRVSLAAKYFLKEAENRSLAMSVASRKMEEYLAKSFSGLPAGDSETSGTESQGGVDFNWSVRTTEWLVQNAPLGISIPAKQILVYCSYYQERMNGQRVLRSVRLLNQVPYPYIHILSHKEPAGASVPTTSSPPLVTDGDYSTITSMPIAVNLRVKSDLMIIYNISLNVTSAIGVEPIDTIWTRCILDGVERPIVTRTPIITQLIISNAVGINEVPSGRHSLEIQWVKDTAAGTVRLKELNVIVVQVEDLG